MTDGLRAEREQGITIDVAYRYFSTAHRKFIIADTPGHEQYTRNMATGASTADLAIILIDARYGVLTQTKRHSFITSLLGIRHVLVAVNKMDLVEYRQDVFEQIRGDYKDFAARLDLPDVHFIPLAALHGDNVVEPSANMPWYNGNTLMNFLEIGLHRFRSQPGGLPLSGSVRQPAPSRFPRILRDRRLGHHSAGGRSHGPAIPQDAVASSRS